MLTSALSYRPLSFVNGKGFQLLAKTLIDIGARYPNANAQTLFSSHSIYSRRVLPTLAEETRSEIRTSLSAQFKTIPSCLPTAAFTDDHWTDKYCQVEYTSVAVSFVDKEFNLNVYNTCVKEYEETKHVQSIKNDLRNKLKKFDICDADINRDDKFVFVSDSDAKLVAALRQDFDRQSSVAHDSILAVKYALKSIESSPIGAMIEDCKTMVRYFKKSGLNRQLTKSLKQEISTRFNSVYIMLTSVEEVFD